MVRKTVLKILFGDYSGNVRVGLHSLVSVCACERDDIYQSVTLYSHQRLSPLPSAVMM